MHRITNPWEACEVTWNNFGGSYSPAVEATFNASTDWAGHSVDVTSLSWRLVEWYLPKLWTSS